MLERRVPIPPQVFRDESPGSNPGSRGGNFGMIEPHGLLFVPRKGTSFGLDLGTRNRYQKRPAQNAKKERKSEIPNHNGRLLTRRFTPWQDTILPLTDSLGRRGGLQQTRAGWLDRDRRMKVPARSLEMICELFVKPSRSHELDLDIQAQGSEQFCDFFF